jgi:phage terminase large subunit-like protein
LVINFALPIENKGCGMSLIQDLRQEHIHAVPVDPEKDKVIRMQAQTARLRPVPCTCRGEAHG